jgi:hypothetical protein
VKRRWYEFRAQAKGAAEIVIYDEIGAFGIPAKAFIDELKVYRSTVLRHRVAGSCRHGERRELGRSYGGGGLVAVALDDPGPVVGVLEGMERLAQLVDGGEAADPEQVLLERADEAFGTTIALGLATKAGEGSMPRKASSVWKSWATYWLPWSWRSFRPLAIPSAKAPKPARTPCRIGSRASKRVARRAAWMPMHSLEQ